MSSSWKLSYAGEALVVSSGMVYLGKRKPQGLFIGDALEMIKAHPKLAYYEKLIKRRVTLGQALEIDFNKLGKEVEMHTSISLNTARDRDFGVLPRNGGQLFRFGIGVRVDGARVKVGHVSSLLSDGVVSSMSRRGGST